MENIRKYYIQHKWVQYILWIFLVAGILSIVIPFVLSEGYTYLCEDDFSFEAGARDAAEEYGKVKGAFFAAHRYYMTWQGTYFSNFIWQTVRPYMRWGMPGFHAVMIFGAVVFFWSLYVAIRTICKKKILAMSICFLVLSAVLSMEETFGLKELLFWYTGAVNYTWVLAASLLTLALQLKIGEEQNKRKQWMLAGVSIVTALIGSGGALMITAVQCACLLLVLALSYDEIREKKLIAVPFLTAFAGALWNACAPGNFARNDSTMSEYGYGVCEALRDTLFCWKEHIAKVINKPLFILILAAVFMVTAIWGRKMISKGVSHIKLFMVMAVMLATQYLAAFPAVLGYHGIMDSARTVSTFDMIIKMTLIFAVMTLAQWSAEHIGMINKILMAILVVSVVFGIICRSEIKESIKEGYTYNLMKELYNGTVRDVYKVREATLSQLDSAADGEDVIVYSNPIPSNKTMYGMGLQVDSEALVNRSAAGLFKLNSVTVIYKE